MPLLVIKKDDKREPFNREKIVRGLVRSAYKRPVSSEDIETTVANVERKIRQLDSNEVESDVIGEFVMQEFAVVVFVNHVVFASQPLNVSKKCPF